MINRFILLSIQNKVIVFIFTIALVITGLIAFQELPVDAVPDITNNQVQIITTAPSFAAQDIERKITFPIEQACSNISGIKEIRSFSRFGLSLITIVLDDDVDVYWARQQVSERLQLIQNVLSTDVGQAQLAPITTGLGEIYQYIVRPEKGYEKKYSLTELREIQDWIIRRQLLGTKGVADVSSFGGKLKQIEIGIHPYQLQTYQISLNDVIAALENNNQNTGSAYIEKNSTAYFIRTEGLITSISDIKNICIKKSDNGIPIQIKDVASVKISYAPRYGSLIYTSKNGEVSYETAGGIVLMLKGENSNQVVERVKKKIAEIQKTLPKGVAIEPFLDRTKMVHSTIQTVFKNLMEGAIIVIVVLILFLGNFRYGILVASVIPLSMLFAIILMRLFHVSGNLMSLGALDFGLIVDGAVIITEAVLYRLTHFSVNGKLDTGQSDKLVFTTTSKLMNAAVFGQIIILIVYLPILYFTGIEGKMFRPMAQTVIFALAGAFILSITYVPVMLAWISKSGKITNSVHAEVLMEKIESIYIQLFKFLFKNARKLIIGIIIVFILSLYLLIQLGGEFMPTLEEGDFAVETRLITGSGLSTSIRYCQEASTLLAKEFPDEVQKVVSKIGSGEIPTDPMPIESADMMVILNPVKQWKKANSFNELAIKMQEKLQSIAGLSTNFQYPAQMRFNELIAGAKQDVVCKLFGENIDTLIKYARQLSEIISKIDGVEGIYEEPIFGQPQIVVQFNREKLSQFNIDIKTANTVVKSIVAGNTIGQYFENERKFDIVIRVDSVFKNSNNIHDILISSKDGYAVPLNKIAEIKIITDVNQIQREDAKRRIIVGFNVRGRDVESVINELQKKLKNTSSPYGYYIKFGGSFENLQSAKQRLMITVPIALTLILLMLYFSFNSIKSTMIIYTTIPLSLIGGILFLYFRQIPFSISAGVGFIALFGIAILNGIVLISEFRDLKKQHSNGLKIILKGIKIRLRPVIMTASVASLGFLPMFLNTEIGSNVQRPLATVVIGGLFTSTLLTLFVLPILFYHFELKKMKLKLKTNISSIVLLIFITTHISKGQIIVNYPMCIDSALKNNHQLKMQNIISEYQKELINTNWNLNKTNIQLQYGQYNSAYTDNAIHIQQTINFPANYIYQKQIFTTEWNIAELRKELEKKNIKSTVGKLFYDIIILSEKLKLLGYLDSIYQESIKLFELTFKAGNISELEKNILVNHSYENKMKLLEFENEKKKLIVLLQLLTQINDIKDIEYQEISASINLSDTINIESHPSVLIAKENILYRLKKYQIEKTKILPDINLGYVNQTLTGFGYDNTYYLPSRRFQYIYAGIELPVFFSSYKNKIRAEKKLIQYAYEQYEWEKNLNTSQLQKLLNDFKTNKKIIEQYELNLLSNTDKIIYSSNLNYQKGNIGFLEWINYITQSIQTKNNYLYYIQQQNQIIFELNQYFKN